MTETSQNQPNQGVDRANDSIDQENQTLNQLANLKEDIKQGFVKKLQEIPNIEDKLQKAFTSLVEGKIPGPLTKVLGFFGILKKVSSFLSEEKNISGGLSLVLVETILEGNKLGKYGLYILLKKTLLDQFDGNDKQKLESILSSLEKVRPAFKKTEGMSEGDIQNKAYYEEYVKQLEEAAKELQALKNEITGTSQQNTNTPPNTPQQGQNPNTNGSNTGQQANNPSGQQTGQQGGQQDSTGSST